MKQKRVKHYDTPGHAHELTFSCFQNQPFLSSDIHCEWLIQAIDKAKLRQKFHVWAYVIMHDHVHLLIYPTESVYSIAKILWGIKYPVALRAVAYAKENASKYLESMADIQPNGRCTYRFWKRGGGYDRNLKEPQAIKNSIEYIHYNPVRKKLVTKPEDWKWSSAGIYAGCENYPLSVDTQFIPF